MGSLWSAWQLILIVCEWNGLWICERMEKHGLLFRTLHTKSMRHCRLQHCAQSTKKKKTMLDLLGGPCNRRTAALQNIRQKCMWCGTMEGPLWKKTTSAPAFTPFPPKRMQGNDVVGGVQGVGGMM